MENVCLESGKMKEIKKENFKKDNKELIAISKMEITDVFKKFNSSFEGLTEEQVNDSILKYGQNIVKYKKDKSNFKKMIEAFINPFTMILMILAIVSVFTDIILVEKGNQDYIAVVIILAMVIISGILKYTQEIRSGEAAEKLLEMIETTAAILRPQTGLKEIPLDEITVGDIVHISAGDMIPADIRIIEAKDLLFQLKVFL